MKEFIKALVYGPDSRPSLVCTMSLAAFLLFAAVTVYLVISGNTFAEYAIFATVTCGGGLVTKIGDKYMNNKPPNQSIGKGQGLC